MRFLTHLMIMDVCVCGGGGGGGVEVSDRGEGGSISVCHDTVVLYCIKLSFGDQQFESQRIEYNSYNK